MAIHVRDTPDGSVAETEPDEDVGLIREQGAQDQGIVETLAMAAEPGQKTCGTPSGDLGIRQRYPTGQAAKSVQLTDCQRYRLLDGMLGMPGNANGLESQQ